MQKVFINRDDTITFKCPKCNNSKTVNASNYKNLKEKMVTVVCDCGNTYYALIEKRKRFRKRTNFPGTFVHIVSGIPKDRGNMIVIDVSRTGLKIKLNAKRKFNVGDKIVVEFHLDDKNRSLIKKECIIKNNFEFKFGLEFISGHPSDPSDKAIGFYLF